MVTIPEEGEVHYRIQETRKLSTILAAIESEERLSQLLGPIKSMAWIQNYGAEKLYFHIENPFPKLTTKNNGWFSFTTTEKRKIDTDEFALYKKNLAREVMNEIKRNPQRFRHLKTHQQETIESSFESSIAIARKRNIVSETGLSFFLMNDLYYPELMTSKDATTIAEKKQWPESKRTHQLGEMIKQHTNTLR